MTREWRIEIQFIVQLYNSFKVIIIVQLCNPFEVILKPEISVKIL